MLTRILMMLMYIYGKFMNNLIFLYERIRFQFHSRKMILLLLKGKKRETMKNEVQLFLNSFKELNRCMLDESNVEGG